MISSRCFVTKNGLIFGISPVRKLVVTKLEVGTVGVVVLIDEPVPMRVSLETRHELLNILVNLVKSGGVINELELVGTDGGGRREASKSGRFHP